MEIMVKIVKRFRKGNRMSREWQQTKQREYVLPDAVYYQSLWAVRDFNRMEKRLAELRGEEQKAPKSRSIVREPDVLGTVWQPTEENALEKVILEERVSGIRNALSIVPEIYRQMVMDSITKKKPVRDFPNNFWKIWKQRFLFTVAKNLSII